MTNRINKRKRAIDELKEFHKHPSNLLVIHYSCESFYDIKDGRTPRITSIAVRFFDTVQTHSFSIHKVAERQGVPISEIEIHYDSLEKKMLDEYYSFVKEHKHCKWIHWNMRDINYGFYAIDHRYQVLGGKPFVIGNENKYDLGRKIIEMYSNKLIGHPRLEKLIEKNNMTAKDFLSGKDEALAFENKEFVKLHQSTLRKVDILQSLVERIIDNELLTNARWFDMYGISPQSIHVLIAEKWWASFIYSLVMIVIGGVITSLLNL